jgi:hypothetical protein
MGVRPGEEVICSVSGHRFEFRPAHREDTDSPVVAWVGMAVPMSLANLAAALWININCGMSFDDIADDTEARAIIMGTVFNDGAMAIDDTMRDLDEITPGTDASAILDAVRVRVAELFGPPPVVPAPRRPRSGATR